MTRAIRGCCLLAAIAAGRPGRAGGETWPDIIRELLDRPAPVADWRGHAPYRKGPPPDDAPLEVLAAWWGEADRSDEPGLRPSAEVGERFLRAVRDRPEDLAELAPWIPRTIEARAAVERIVAASGERMPREWREAASKWLEDTKTVTEEGLRAAAPAARHDGAFAVIGDEALRKLLRTDRAKGREILEKHRSGEDRALAGFALRLLHEDTLERGGDAEGERKALRAVVEDPKAPPFAREEALLALAGKPWPGRDEWFPGLFRDAGLGYVSSEHFCFRPLARAVEADPDRLIPLVAPLVESGDRVVRDNAVTCLIQFQLERARPDALRPLLPWLDDPDWARVDDASGRLRLIQSLDRVKIPESVPGLIAVLRKEGRWAREGAADALAFQGDQRAVPALREVLETERDGHVLRSIIDALLALGAVDGGEKVAAVEAYARQLSTEEGKEALRAAWSDREDGPRLAARVSLGAHLAGGALLDDALTARLYARAEALREGSPEKGRIALWAVGPREWDRVGSGTGASSMSVEEKSFQGRSLAEWIEALGANREAPPDLFEAFPRSTGLLAAALRHASAEVRRRAALFLVSFEDRFGDKIDIEVDEAEGRTSWRIDPDRHTAYARAAREIAPVLGERLRDPEPEVRRLASDALSNFGEEAAPAVPSLLASLSDPALAAESIRTLGYIGPEARPAAEEIRKVLLDDARPEEPRAAAAAAIGRIRSGDPAVVSALLAALASPSPAIQRAAVGGLGFAGQATDAAIAALAARATGGHPSVRPSALLALAGLDREGKTAIPLLAGAAKDPDPEIRLMAVAGLGRQGRGARRVLGILSDVLLDPDPKVRARATAEAAFLAGSLPRFPGGIVPRETFFARIRKNLDDPSPEVREAAAAALSNWGAIAPGDVPRLREMARRGPKGSRADAILRLLDIGPPDAETRELLLRAAKDESSRVRSSAVAGLAGSRDLDPESLAALRSALRDADSRVRYGAAERLLEVEDAAPEAEAALRDLLSDRNGALRLWSAGRLLARRPEEAGCLSLILQGLRDPDPQVRRDAVRASLWGKLLGPEVERALKGLLAADENRLEAAGALVHLGSRDAAILPVLVAGLESDDFSARRLAARCLARLGEAAAPASEAIRRALGDEDDEVRGWAGEALRRIGGGKPAG